MVPPHPKPLTPMRSPVPPWAHRQKPNFCGRTASKRRFSIAAAAAASSSEKETPTVVFTETSPLPNNDSCGGNATVGDASYGTIGPPKMAAAGRLIATTPSRPRPENLFVESPQNSFSSSPGSKAEQSLAKEGDCASSTSSSNADGDGGRQDNSNDEILSEDSEIAKHRQAISLIQNVLDSGIASICRLRKLFPPSFFEKMDVDGTTVTRFKVEELKRIAYHETDMDENEYSDEDEASMLKSVDAKTQKTMSPLTLLSLAPAPGSGYSDNDKRLAMEALLVLRWMQDKGVGAVLRQRNLARIIFGICAPCKESTGERVGEVPSNNDELIESYSFSVSCLTPDNPGEINLTQMRSAVGSVFQNLNGFHGGQTRSRSVVPSKTQGTQASYAFSQASRVTSHYDTQVFSVDFSLSQKHHRPRTDVEMSQKSSLMASMSQSIRASVKKNSGFKIPSSRYLTLRVDFTNSMQQNELPSALRQKPYSTVPCLHTSPVPIKDGDNGGEPIAGSRAMRVTPLGRIVESSYSGLCVDVAAHNRVAKVESQEEDEKDFDISQFSSRSRSSPVTQPQQHQDGKLSEKCQATKDDSFLWTHQMTNSNLSQTENLQDEMMDKENTDIQVGGKAFGVPYGLKGKVQMLPCDIHDHRTTKSCLNGKEREEFKCYFHSNELKAVGKKKQWLLSKKIVSYRHMTRNIEEALSKREGEASPRFLTEIAGEMRVDPGFVQRIAKKRKRALHDKNVRLSKRNGKH